MQSTTTSAPKTIPDFLKKLGVTPETLTQEERNFLDINGYLPLPGLLQPEQLDAFTSRFQELLDMEGDSAGTEVHQEGGTARLANLVDKGTIFEICISHPRVLATIHHVLGDELKLSSLNARFALPGAGHQNLHADYGESVPPGDYRVCNSIWLLDDFVEENGPTRVVPGSHRDGRHPREVLEDPAAPHPDQRLLLAPAGTVVVFNSNTWHGGTLNRTDRPRRAMHSYFCRRDQEQQLDQKAFLSEETLSRLSPELRHILDV